MHHTLSGRVTSVSSQSSWVRRAGIHAHYRHQAAFAPSEQTSMFALRFLFLIHPTRPFFRATCQPTSVAPCLPCLSPPPPLTSLHPFCSIRPQPCQLDNPAQAKTLQERSDRVTLFYADRCLALAVEPLTKLTGPSPGKGWNEGGQPNSGSADRATGGVSLLLFSPAPSSPMWCRPRRDVGAALRQARSPQGSHCTGVYSHICPSARPFSSPNSPIPHHCGGTPRTHHDGHTAC